MNKFFCGEPLPTGCLLFSGELPSFIPAGTFDCIPSLDEVLKQHATKIEALLDSTSLKTLNVHCFYFDSKTATVKSVLEKTVEKICEVDVRLSALQKKVDELQVGSLKMQVDLKCMKPQAAPCATASDTYTLQSIIQVLIAEICALKAKLPQ